MRRAANIEALIARAKADAASLRPSYESALHEKHVSEGLKISIKIILESLRSSLDYLAREIFESCCAGAKKAERLYFPIRSTASDFRAAIAQDFPNLNKSAPRVFAILESAQPYVDPWLGKFNRLNNHNKHEDLVEQVRIETRRVTVSAPGGSVSWGPGVTFGGGVSVMGVPIDPRTQLPVPNSSVTTEVATWVDFRFREIDEPVLTFVQESVHRVEALYQGFRIEI